MSYPQNTECIYTITATPGNAITLNLDYNLETSEFCADDYIEVREKDGAGRVIEALCGNGERRLVVNTTTWIKFKSDEETTGKGFSLYHSYGG